MYIGNYRRRTEAVFFFFLLFLIFCLCRLFFIQSFRSRYLVSLAKKQQNLFIELEPLRGTIFDRNGRPLAVNIHADSLFACPNEMKEADKQDASSQLAGLLGLKKEYLNNRLWRNKSFIWITRKLSPQQSEAVRALNLKGLSFIKESKRSYPNSYLASHIIGFAGLDNVGLEGIELVCDKYLLGQQGWAVFLRDARQKKLELWEKMVLPKDGYDIVLSIDEVIQYIAERELEAAFNKYHAKGASIVVMDPHTGEILALANRPTFALDGALDKLNKESMRNRSVCDLFEPGSVFKIVTLSAAFEEGKVKEEDKFFCENGEYKIGNHTLHDHRPHGWMTATEVFRDSSNIGTVKIGQILGPETLYNYIKRFGFGSKLGVDLPGEISGIIRPPKNWSKISIAAIPMGQEVGVTALQLASAISVIANGGVLMKPYVIKQIRDKHGFTIREFSPEAIQKVISIETAQRVKNVLKTVIEEGTGKLAAIPGYSAAGKTGTAQKLEANGTYSHSKFIASFIGFAPAEEPLITIIVTIDEPRPYYFGGVVAAPVFKQVAHDTIKYLKGRQFKEGLLTSYENKRVN